MFQRLLPVLLCTLAGTAVLTARPVAAAPKTTPAAAHAHAKKTPQPIKRPIATIETNKGTITFELYTDDAPITAKNFIGLAKRHFFDGLTFHRVVPGFVIQGGDPLGTGEGGSGKTIPLEVTPKLSHDAAGVVAMARDSNPDSASSQFYITLAETKRLDGKYAVFGRVLTGIDVVMKIQVGDKMKTVTVRP
jgi:peptidyl-prolyl cis-trans isomerase B (cyclophilin B)